MRGRTIVVPLAGPRQDSEGIGEVILPLARVLASKSRAVVLVSIVELPYPRAEASGTIDAQWSDELEQYLESVAATFDGPPVETVVRHNISIGSEIAQLCESLDEPVVVMASTGRKGLRRALRGSVAVEVVQSAPCPVMILPANAAKVQPASATGVVFDHVLVPLDGTPLAEEVLSTGLPALGELASHIHLLTVTDTADDEAAQRYLEAIAAELTDCGYQVTWDVRHGDPHKEIIAAAQAHGVALIAMATHGRRGFNRLISGSVAEDVVRDGGMPVLIVRGSAGAITAPDERRTSQLDQVSAAVRDARYRTVKVKEIMSAPAVTVHTGTPLADVAQAMLDHGIGSVPVTGGSGQIAGIITEADFIGQRESAMFSREGRDAPLPEMTDALTAGDIATSPVVTVGEDDLVSVVVEIMNDHDFTHVPVVRDGVPVGVVSHHDLLQVFARGSSARDTATSE